MATPFDTQNPPAPSFARPVRTASDKQIAFLRNLIADRPWKDLDDAEFVARVAIVSVTLTFIDNPKNDGTPDVAKAILAGNGSDGDMLNDIITAANQAPFGIAECSAMIDRLKNTARGERRDQPEREDGFYMLGETIVKVYHTVHGANKQVGARFAGVLTPKLDASDSPTGKMRPAEIEWEYGGMALAADSRLVRMTPEQAADFGQVYGRCGRCASPLTKQESIERGLGPVCAGKS